MGVARSTATSINAACSQPLSQTSIPASLIQRSATRRSCIAAVSTDCLQPFVRLTGAAPVSTKRRYGGLHAIPLSDDRFPGDFSSRTLRLHCLEIGHEAPHEATKLRAKILCHSPARGVWKPLHDAEVEGVDDRATHAQDLRTHAVDDRIATLLLRDDEIAI